VAVAAVAASAAAAEAVVAVAAEVVAADVVAEQDLSVFDLIPLLIWSAPPERSGDGALDLTDVTTVLQPISKAASLPPHSKLSR
jgi:hypothetical protein